MGSLRSKWIGELLLVWVILALSHSDGLAKQPSIKSIRGVTKRVAVRAASGTWSSTLSTPVPVRKKHQTRFIGHYPGFRTAKQKANQRLEKQFTRHQKAMGAQSYSLAPQAAASALSVFEGPSESDTPYIPPDSQIAAGPNYLVVVINSLIAIYDKTGVQQGSYQDLSSFFSTLGLNGDIFDPRIIYDQTDNRYILSAAEVDMTNLTNGHVLLAVSQTSDPTGLWNKYAINFMGRNLSNTANTFPDFPTLGMSSSAVYIATNQFQLTQSCLSTDTEGCQFSDAWIAVIGLPQLLSSTAPSTLAVTMFKDVTNSEGRLAFTIQPALTYGTPSSEFLVSADFSANPSSTLNLFAIPTSGTPTLNEANLTVPPFSMPPNAVQGGSSSLIDTNDYRLLNAVWANGSLWCGQNVEGSPGNVAARWYDIALPDLASMNLTQSGTISGNGEAYYPAISVKADGMAGVAFTTSSSSLPPSSAFTAREPTDTSGSMRGSIIYRNGTGPYDESVGNRWGDYSGISEDPDGSSLWMITEYAGTPDPHFGTSIAQVAGAPTLTASPTTLDFGSVSVGTTSTSQSVTISNVSSSSVTVGQATVAGQNATSFSMTADSCSNTSLASGQTCKISLAFTPATSTAESVAYVSIPYGGGSTAITVGLAGGGYVRGVLTITPQSVTFPATVQQTASAPQTVVISNTGNADATIQYLTIQGDFTETNTCGASLAPGESCQVNITFRPTSAGNLQGYINFSSNTQAAFYSINFSGVGVTAPAVLLCPASLSFANQATNTSSSPKPVILTNSGSDQLTITGISVSGDFSQTNDCTGSMAPRSSCVINVTFTPTAIGSTSGTLDIYDDARGSPQSLQITGTGATSTATLLLHGTENQESAGRSGQQSAQSVLLSRLGSAIPKPELNDLTRSHIDRQRQQASKSYFRLPLSFAANDGQTNPRVKFVSRGAGYAVFLTARSAVLELVSKKKTEGHPKATTESRKINRRPSFFASVVRMGLVGANRNPHEAGLDELPGKANFFIGNDASKWHTNVPLYAKVKYQEVYPGVNLVYYGNQRQLEYDFVVAPGADPGEIRLRFRGASSMRLDREGNLVLTTAAGKISFHKPLVYQRTTGRGLSAQVNPKSRRHDRRLLKGHYVLLASNQVAFHVGHYNRREPLVIDPVLSFSTYLGGSGGETANAIAVDSSGEAYIAGKTGSMNFPVTSNAFLKTCGTQQYPCSFPNYYDGFVAKLSADGSTLLYATYLGGPAAYGTTVINGIAVDSSGDAYVAGSIYSNNFPTTSGAFQPQTSGNLEFPGVSSAFVTKLNATGSSLVYSTYLSGTPANTGVPLTPPDGANAIALDSAGDAYVVGTTSESDFPTTPGAFQTTGPSSGNVIGFVTKFNAAGSGLIFSTFLGGSRNDELNAITVDATGNAYVAGIANSPDFPTTPGAYQKGSYFSSQTDAYLPNGSGVIAKFNPSGKIEYSTYLGGPGGSSITSIAVNSAGAAYVTGATGSGFPVTPNALATTYQSYAAFVAKLHPDGCALLYSTYLNPPAFADTENPHAIALDSSGDIYVAGGVLGVSLGSYPGVNELQPEMQLSPGFVSEMDPSGTKLLFSTPLGGSGGDNNYGSEVRGMALDPSGDIYVTGMTVSQDFPVLNALQPVAGGSVNATKSADFVAKISPGQATGITLTRPSLTFLPSPVGTTGGGIQSVGLQNNQSTALNISSVTVSGGSFSLVKTVNPPPACSGTIAAGAGCAVVIQFTPTTGGLNTGTLTISDDGPGSPQTVALNGEGVADFTLDASPNPVVAGGQAQYTIYASVVSGAPSSAATDSIALSCSGASPATCSFSPTAIAPNGTIPNNTTLTVSNLSAVSVSPLNFSVVGTQGTETYSLPLSLAFKKDFSLAAAPTSDSVSPGQTATYGLNVNPLNGFTQNVSLSCSGAPASATCTVSPSSLSLNGSQVSIATVTVTTTAPSLAFPRQPTNFPPVEYSLGKLLFWLLLLTMVATLIAARRRLGTQARTALIVAGLMFMLLLASCGGGGGGAGSGGSGGSSGTPAGTYNLTITGKTSTLSHTVNLTLKVQ